MSARVSGWSSCDPLASFTVAASGLPWITLPKAWSSRGSEREVMAEATPPATPRPATPARTPHPRRRTRRRAARHRGGGALRPRGAPAPPRRAHVRDRQGRLATRPAAHLLERGGPVPRHRRASRRGGGIQRGAAALAPLG